MGVGRHNRGENPELKSPTSLHKKVKNYATYIAMKLTEHKD